MPSGPAEETRRKRFKDPKKVIESAVGNGWVTGKHTEQDKQVDLNKYVEDVEQGQDAVLEVYVM